MALTGGDELVVVSTTVSHVVDPDAGTIELLAPYPEGMGGRANDANADLAGNLVTGTLNLSPGPGGVLVVLGHSSAGATSTMASATPTVPSSSTLPARPR